MTEYLDTNPSKREKIVRALFAFVQNMVDEAGQQMWAGVYRGDPEYWQHRAIATPAVYVEEGEDAPTELMTAWQNRALRIYIHFRFPLAAGVEPFERYNYYVGKLQSAIIPDPNYTLGGLAIDVTEVMNVPQVYVNDSSPGGQLVLDVTYRASRNDPYV